MEIQTTPVCSHKHLETPLKHIVSQVTLGEASGHLVRLVSIWVSTAHLSPGIHSSNHWQIVQKVVTKK